MIDKPLKPEIVVFSFEEKDIHSYIETLDEIQQTFGPEQPILVQIDSYGGECFGFIRLYEYLISLGNPIITFTSSKAMSAGAFLLATAGRKGMRFASPHSTILVHEIQAGAFGDIKEMEQKMESINVLNERILTIFAQAIGLKNSTEVRTMIKQRSVGHDLTLSAQEAKALNIIDEVAYIKSSPMIGFTFEVLPVKVPAQAKKTKKTKRKS